MISCLKKKNRERKQSPNFRKDVVNPKKMRNLEKWSAKKIKQINTQITTSQPNGENSSATNNSTPNSSLSFSWKQTLYSSIARVNLKLPKIPNKKAEVIQRLATKYKTE